MLNSKAYWHFRAAGAFCLLLTCIAGAFVAYYGKKDSFLIINHLNDPSLDQFFQYFTYLGDGAIWVPLLAYVIWLRRDFLVTVLVAFAICTLLTQFCKWVIFADALRPLASLHEAVRTVPGVETHHTSSFPSGHTSIAFTYAMLMAYLLKHRAATFLFPLIAFFVGYSRVYLAQHFVTDVFAGSLVGLASALLALLFYARYQRRKVRTPAGATVKEEAT